MPFRTKKTPTKIIVAGTGSGWELIPRQTDAIIYCLNDYIRVDKYRVQPDVLFIMDVLDEKPQIVSGIDNLGEVVARINQMGCTLIAPYKYAEIPNSEPFPIEQCVKRFGLPYFTNTICYMIAYALLAGAKEIEIYGVNQAGSHEYTEERGGVEYWIGVANGMGVKVSINGKDSQLLKFKGRYGGGLMYGYLQSYEQYLTSKKKFGDLAVRQLMRPQPPISRTVRKLHES